MGDVGVDIVDPERVTGVGQASEGDQGQQRA